MSRFRGKTKLLMIAAALLLLLGVVVVAVPLWLPWVFGPISKRFGLEYARYERLGYGRFVLHQAAYDEAGSQFQADRIEAFVPTVWLWRLFVNGTEAQPYLRVIDWQFEQTTAPERKPRKERSPHEIVRTTESVLRRLEYWIPSAALESGAIAIGGRSVRIPSTQWRDGRLIADALLPELEQSAILRADVQGGMPYRLGVQVPEIELSVTNRIFETNSTIAVAGELYWLTNRVELTARLGTSDRFPESASVRARSFAIPAERLKLEGYEVVAGSLLFEWAQGHFDFNLSAHAEPEMGRANAMPIDAIVRAEGSTNRIEISNLSIVAPWLTAELSRGVELNFGGDQLFPKEALFRVAADLSEQPWIDMEGAVSGLAILMPTTNGIPDVTFEIVGRDVGTARLKLDELDVAGQMNWPMLVLNSAQAELPGGARAEASGGYHFGMQTVSNAVVQVSGLISSNLLPAGVRLQTMLLDVTAAGPVTNLMHSGKLQLSNFKTPKTAFLSLSAEWNGEGMSKLDRFQTELRSGESVLSVGGSAEWRDSGASARIERLRLMDGVLPILALAQPIQLRLERGEDQGDRRWRAVIDPSLALRGGNRNFELAGDIRWPERGKFALQLENIRSGLFEAFFAKALPAVEVERFGFTGNWTNAPLDFNLDIAARYQPEEGPPYSGGLKMQSTEGGTRVDEILVATESSAVLKGEGVVPVTIEPSATNMIALHTNEPVRFQLSSGPNELFWDRIWRTTGIGLEAPQIELQLSGTLASPRGRMTVKADQIRLDRFRTAEHELPRLNQVRAEIDITPDAIEIERMVFLVEGQMVETTATLPFTTNWNELREILPLRGRAERRRNESARSSARSVQLAMRNPPPQMLAFALAAQPAEGEAESEANGEGFSWSNLLNIAALTGRVRMQNVDLGKVAAFFPRLISPQGEMDLDLRLFPENRLGGHLTIRGAATRPAMPLGVIDDIQARLEFEGRRVEIDYMRGILGGAPIEVDGHLDLARRGPEGLPEFNLTLTGTNVPLVRSPSLILRSDLAVNVVSRTNAPPVVSGDVQLRKSYYLADVRDLIPGGVATPEQRPPYFSIDIEPLRSWRLDLRVLGDDFMNVRTPLFRGLASVTMKLEGTLLEPLALGDVTIDSGAILFPFANIRVRQGIVSMTSERPHQPELFVIAADRVFSYDIRIEVRGPAQEPIIEFTSTPPLSSEEIVLMLTAGQLPRKGPTLGQRQRATRLGMFLGKGLMSKFSAGEGRADRLTIRTGENISEQGQETYSAEYRLSENWAIVGEYDRFNEFNLGLKWRVYSR